MVLAGLLTSRTGAIYWQLAFCLFGGTVAVALPAIGGAVILPAVLFLPFLMLHAWREQRGRGYLQRTPQAAVWLALAVLWGLLSAIVMPRLFAGQLQVISIDRTSISRLPLSPLRPVSGNITQSGYAIGAFASFFAMRALLVSPSRLEHFRDAVLLLAGLDVVSALLNLGEFYLGFPKTLEYIRTAYAVYGDYEVAGIVRIHGTFPETSAFSSFTLPLFAFCFSLWLQKVRPLRSGVLALFLLTFLLISTSTTAYAGLSIYLAIFLLGLLYRLYLRNLLPRAEWFVVGTLVLVLFLGGNFLFETKLASSLTEYLNVTVFGKMNSSSGADRSMWNRQAWSNVLDTYGFGVGLGTIRCSSMALVLLANLGVIGTLFYCWFLKTTLARPSGGHLEPVPEAARQATVALLCAALVSAPVFDLGIAFYCYAAAASVGSARAFTRRSQSRADRADEDLE